MTGCVTATSIGGTSDPHGLLGGGAANTAVTEGAQEIASYTVIVGLVESGYADYAAYLRIMLNYSIFNSLSVFLSANETE